MEGVNRILAAIDFSRYSSQVIRFAAGLARELRVELVLVNVINQRDVDAVEMVQRDYSGVSVETFIQSATAERLELLNKLMAAEAPKGPAPVRRRVRVGVPFKEILSAVEADFITGTSRIEPSLLGKATIWLESLLIAYILININLPLLPDIAYPLFIATAGVSILSALHYMFRGFRVTHFS